MGSVLISKMHMGRKLIGCKWRVSGLAAWNGARDEASGMASPYRPGLMYASGINAYKEGDWCCTESNVIAR